MHKTALLLLIGALLMGLAYAAPADEPKTGSTPSQVKDLCKDCIDPYIPTTERAKFFKAAGVDNELEAKEFETDKVRADGFIRKFDSWTGLLAFDKNASKTLDWFEADAYRRDVRKRVLGAYDTNKDGQLKLKERDAANKALAAGKLPAAKTLGPGKVIPVPPGSSAPPGGVVQPPTRTEPRIIRGGGGQGPIIVRGGGQLPEQYRLRMFDKDKDGKLNDDEQAAMAKWEADSKKRREEWARRSAQWRKLYEELRKKHDQDGDGQLDADERKAYYEEYQERAKIVRYDKDGDGALSDAEREAMEAQQAEWKKRAEDSRRKWLLQRWDKDKDGEISEKENAAMEAQQAEWKKQAEQRRNEYQEMRKKHDKDGDGKLDAEERKAYYEEYRERAKIVRWDKDGDGQLSDAEREAMEAQQAEWKKRAEDSRRKWELRRYDKNKNGKLDEAERKTMEEERAKWRSPRSVTINGRPMGGGMIVNGGRMSGVVINGGRLPLGGGGGVTVWESVDGRTRGTIIIRRPGQDEEDE